MRFSPVHARRRAAVMQVPWRHKRRRMTVATPAFVRRAHRAGMQVHVWTGEENSQWVSIDDAESMHTLLDMGVDGLITDRTDVLKDVLVRRGQWMDSHTMTTPAGIANLEPVARRKEQRAWYFYDWANSAFSTTIAGVLFGPYLIAIAEEAAVDNRIQVLGLSIAAGRPPVVHDHRLDPALAVLLPLLGAVADRTARKKDLLAGFAWAGAAAAALLFFVTGDNWQLGVASFIVANLCLGAAAVFNDAILCLISTEEERDRVSSRGWAYGYAGGGLLLAANFVLVTTLPFGLSEGMAVRISMLSAAVWWAGFTIIPFLGHPEPPARARRRQGRAASSSRASGSCGRPLKSLRQYPVALTFLLAYLFFNDGIQTVIASASIYGVEELGFGTGTVLATYLVVQFVAVFGALGFGRAAGHFGAKSVILAGLGIWVLIVTAALFVPKRALVAFLAARGGDRDRAGRHPGAVPVLLQPADPEGPRGGVLQLLPRDGAGNELVRDAASSGWSTS